MTDDRMSKRQHTARSIRRNDKIGDNVESFANVFFLWRGQLQAAPRTRYGQHEKEKVHGHHGHGAVAVAVSTPIDMEMAMGRAWAMAVAMTRGIRANSERLVSLEGRPGSARPTQIASGRARDPRK